MNYNDMMNEAHAVSGRHMLAAAAACVASLLVHGVLLFWLQRVRFDLPFASRPPRRTPQRAMRLQEAPPPAGAEARAVWAREGLEAALRRAEAVREPEALALPPDELAIEPEPAEQVAVTGDEGAVAPPGVVPERTPWEPRQEIMQIEREIAEAAVPLYERRIIPRLERVSRAPDVTAPVERAALQAEQPLPPPPAAPGAAPGAEAAPAGIPAPSAPAADAVQEAQAQTTDTVARETPEAISPRKPLESFLKASLTVYTSRRDPDYGYFRMDVERAGAEILPVLPRDVVLVQDCSNSMAEKRLYFCRQGLLECLKLIGAEERFNVVRFREAAETCFAAWMPRTAESTNLAGAFIKAMDSRGNTDIFAGIREVLTFERTPGRPVVVLLITDGLATAGLTESTDIIGEFSRANDGAVSVFTMGTLQTANAYLLDLLSYCNRGDSRIVSWGRWDIPEAMSALFREISRPVLGDVSFRFTAQGGCEVYPVQTSNLYLDRPLVLFGRYPAGTERVVCQAVGRSGDTPCDMVFDLGIAEAPRSDDADIRTTWARQKSYDLLSRYARTRDPAILRELKATARRYRIRVPYEDELPGR
ncbi:MAG: VWA domain-containing protein [Lentisphaerae bacterium]|nr:VWA domain-containing protein [Lentisphaerota bacterium]